MNPKQMTPEEMARQKEKWLSFGLRYGQDGISFTQYIRKAKPWSNESLNRLLVDVQKETK